MENKITEVIEQFGYISVFLMIALENIFPPIPSEVILTFGGMMTSFSDLTVMGVVYCATAGSLIGALILYKAGNLLDISTLEKIADKYGGILRITRQDIYKAEHWFKTYGYWTIFLCRFIPLIRSLISIPAGIAKMNLPAFVILTAAGTFIWNLILVSLGAKFGDSWDLIVYYMDIYSRIIYMILALSLLGGIFYLFHKRQKKN